MTYWCYEEHYYDRHKEEKCIVCGPHKDEIFVAHKPIKYKPWTSTGYGSAPLEIVMKELLAVRRKEMGLLTEAEIDEHVNDIEGIEWLEDRVVFYCIFMHGARTARSIGPFLPYGYYIMYPQTTVGECMSCGAACDVYIGCCIRCKPMLVEVMKEVKRNVEIIEDIKASEKIISEFKGKLNERYRPAKDKASRSLVKV